MQAINHSSLRLILPFFFLANKEYFVTSMNENNQYEKSF